MYYQFIVKGVVQGVGFRPYIYRKAKGLGLTGSVKNTGLGVEIIVDDESFISKLDDLPPLAKIDEFESGETENISFDDFTIMKSSESKGTALLPSDIFMCDDCRKELRNKNDRRNGYYFITCTNCGPRFSMIKDYPYDRKNTSMYDFRMCDSCKEEYENPLNRRFHAETIACKDCGPRLILKKGKEELSFDKDIGKIKKTAELIKTNEIVAIKGVGGFHLVSNIASADKIRKILNRKDKPFALLAKDIEMAEKYCNISEKEKDILVSPKRPIVILEKRDKTDLLKVSELSTLGFMLPYTSLHHLLFDFIDAPIVMTSYNLPGKPMIIDEKEIQNIEYALYHEREIVNRVDDSVIKVIGEKPLIIRRSRGFAPLPIKMSLSSKEILAVGAEMNNTICIARDNQAFLSQHIGNTSRSETIRFHNETIETFKEFTRTDPKIIACDMHPDYETSRNARILAKEKNAQLIEIQHHKSHVASVAAEYGLKDYAGIAMDGTGYGEDGTIWGGEVFEVNNHVDFERIGHIEYHPMIGGDSAVKNPKKMLLGILSKILNEKELIEMRLFEEKETRLYLKQLKEDFNVIQTSSAGRILDAVSALLGLCDERTYDGRPAMLLESIATEPLEFEPIIENNILMTTPLFRFLLENIENIEEINSSKTDVDKGRLAATAQAYLAEGLLTIAKKQNKPIVFSGGVAYNDMITKIMLKNNVLINKQVPPGDGGISLGQAYLAGQMDKFKNK